MSKSIKVAALATVTFIVGCLVYWAYSIIIRAQQFTSL